MSIVKITAIAKFFKVKIIDGITDDVLNQLAMKLNIKLNKGLSKNKKIALLLKRFNEYVVKRHRFQKNEADEAFNKQKRPETKLEAEINKANRGASTTLGAGETGKPESTKYIQPLGGLPIQQPAIDFNIRDMAELIKKTGAETNEAISKAKFSKKKTSQIENIATEAKNLLGDNLNKYINDKSLKSSKIPNFKTFPQDIQYYIKFLKGENNKTTFSNNINKILKQEQEEKVDDEEDDEEEDDEEDEEVDDEIDDNESEITMDTYLNNITQENKDNTNNSLGNQDINIYNNRIPFGTINSDSILNYYEPSINSVPSASTYEFEPIRQSGLTRQYGDDGVSYN